ncbi:MAG: ABC transporter permease [Euryarchaeota archaeon]|nr:ABC transporter permease [Euryarchaeota archaeon]
MSDVARADGKLIPTDMQQAMIVMKYDLLKHLRSRRLLGMLAIEALLLILISALILEGSENTFIGAMGGYASFTSTLIIIAATLFAGDAIVSEFQSRTGYLLFPNPVRRSSIFVGKFLSAVLATAIVTVIYYAVAIGVSAIVSNSLEHIDLAFASLGLALLYGVAAVGVGILISSFMKGSTGSLILTFFLLFLILPAVDNLFSLVEQSPTISLTFAAMAISAVLSIPYPPETDMITIPVEGFGEFVTYFHTPSVSTAVLVMIGWILVTVALAYLAFQRREMTA